jgi:signal transduction histidine kinase
MRGRDPVDTLAGMDDTGERTQAGWRDLGWLRELRWRRDLALPAGLAIVQLAAGYGSTLSGHHGARPLHLGVAGGLLLVAGPLALTVRRRHPVAALWVAFAATLAPASSWPAFLSLIVAFFVAATSGRRRAAWVVIVVGYVSSVWLEQLAYGRPATSLDAALLLAAWLAVLVIAAEAVRLRRERIAQTRAARQLDARRRASEERLRMARDLHDVIGHTVSLINVQAGVGLDLMDTQPDQARAALTAIRTVSKEALGELRAMLAAFREDGEDAPRSPPPGLDRLPEIVGLIEAAGLSVATEVSGTRRPLPAAVDLAAFRIVQESLTNVARHAGPAAVIVHLTYAPGRLLVEVTDDGGAADHGPPGAGGGTGIAGMRERAAALGGRLTAGPRPGGGFAVTARLPTGSET